MIVFGSSLSSNQNYFTNSSGGLCDFAAVFETVQQFDAFTPLCVGSSVSDCARFVTPSPTEFPSGSPTAFLSDAPSMTPTSSLVPSGTPTEFPTITPQPTVTGQPSEIPSDVPSQVPTVVGATASPSEFPSTTPTTAPTKSPVVVEVPDFTFPTNAPVAGTNPSGAYFATVASTLALATSLGLCLFFL